MCSWGDYWFRNCCLVATSIRSGQKSWRIYLSEIGKRSPHRGNQALEKLLRSCPAVAGQSMPLLPAGTISQGLLAFVRLKNKEIKFNHWHSTLILLSWVAGFKNSKCSDFYILKLKLHQFNFEDSELSQPKKRKEPPGGHLTCSFWMWTLNLIDLLITTNYW